MGLSSHRIAWHRIRAGAVSLTLWATGIGAAITAIYPGAPAIADDDFYAERRASMVQTIDLYAMLSKDALGRDHLDPRVMEVMGVVPRHAFLRDETLRERDWLSALLRQDPLSIAYADRPVPIGYGQTMSQPFIVALMTDLLAPKPDHIVLEIGTGSGYQAAVLSPLVKHVCSIEIIPELGESAATTLERLGYDNVETRIGDGYYGWEDCGPFDGIVVTAAASHVPPPLLRQLKPGGRMVIPVGGAFITQQLILVEKEAGGRVHTRQILPVAFVPLVREKE